MVKNEDFAVCNVVMQEDCVKAIECATQEILRSTYFCKSKRLPALLRYVIQNTLSGDSGNLKERTVGIEVFGRQQNFEPSNDAVVRVAFGELRKRLALYYSEHPEASVHIDLPVGGYEAVISFRNMEAPPFPLPFAQEIGMASPAKQMTLPAAETGQTPGGAEKETAALSQMPDADPEDTNKYQDRVDGQKSISVHVAPRRQKHVLFWLVLVLAAGTAAGIWSNRLSKGSTDIDRFWGPFIKSQNAIPVIVAMPSHGDAWLNGISSKNMGMFLTTQENYQLPDLSAANAINAFLARRKQTGAIGIAQTTSLAEMHRTPAIVLGSASMNPWAARLGEGLRYQSRTEDGGPIHCIVDTQNPGDRRWSVDLRQSYQNVNDEYVLITRARNTMTGQWWLGISSTMALGALGAQQMLMDPIALEGLYSQLPSSWEQKNLQVVIDFKVVDGSLGASRIVAIYVW